MRKKNRLLILFFAFSFFQLSAQTDSIQDISYYFDDARVTDAKNIFKINLPSIINGDLPIFYERTFNNSLSFELGVGLLLPYYISEFPDLVRGKTPIENPKSGYSFWICPKYYIQRRAPEYNYIGLQYRRRSYNLEDGQNITYDYFTINLGLQLIFGKRFLFDYSLGGGFRFKKEGKLEDSDFIQVACPLMIKLGYIL